jgi:uncharacterized protein YjbI with pentapeptide repeats
MINMTDLIYIQKTFEKEVFINAKINNREFEDCVFKNCDFSNTDFAETTFMDCEFIDCNLSLAKMRNTSLKTVDFRNCKLLGILFHETAEFLFSVQFQDCILDYASFANKKMPKTKFINSSLKETSFIGANLTSSVFDNCNLDGTIFNDTILKATDFATSYNYKIDPEFNPMQKAKFATQGIAGLLDKYDILIN